jgi:DNA polymerase-1
MSIDILPQQDNYKAYQLLHEGTLALADAEERGMLIDVDFVHNLQKEIGGRIKEQEDKMWKTDVGKKWKRRFPANYNLGSDVQLSYILYKVLKLKTDRRTSKGKRSVDQQALEQINHPFVENIVSLRKIKKIKNTYLKNIMTEQVNGILRPAYNLNIPVTFRGSSSNINFQNIPIRTPEGKIIRKAFIPRPGFLICEADYSRIEVGVATCYHRDPNMIADIIDPKKDMHRDMSMKCYKLSKKEWTSETRYCAKNKFVFPQFYGDYYGNNARDLWNAINLMKLKTAKGVPLKKHLKSKNLGTLEKFTNHIKKVEDYFWNERYAVYGKWKEDYYEQYLKNGYVDMYSGFRCHGLMSKNDALNYPIQGTAFHCLLWSFIQVNKWLKKNNYKSRLIGQIHDSIVFELYHTEVNKVLYAINQIMTKDIVRHFPWLIIPLKIEIEASPIGESWYYKKEIKKSPFACNCGSQWMYDKKDNNGCKYWKCPVCDEEYTIGHS